MGKGELALGINRPHASGCARAEIGVIDSGAGE